MPILSLDPSEHHLSTVIWCTGFEGDYSFVQVPGVLNAHGQPSENEGLTEAPGIYFAGVDFSSTRKSGIIIGIAEEARRLVEHIIARRGDDPQFDCDGDPLDKTLRCGWPNSEVPHGPERVCLLRYTGNDSYRSRPLVLTLSGH